jgi:hypothetical protein
MRLPEFVLGMPGGNGVGVNFDDFGNPFVFGA